MTNKNKTKNYKNYEDERKINKINGKLLAAHLKKCLQEQDSNSYNVDHFSPWTKL